MKPQYIVALLLALCIVLYYTTCGGGASNNNANSSLIDSTTTEIADECVGGVLSAGPTRLTAAAELGVPQVVCPGATDMVNFLAPETIPRSFSGRQFHAHNANVSLMRTSAQECLKIGEDIGRKLRQAPATTRCLFPTRGVSALDASGQPFEDKEAR